MVRSKEIQIEKIKNAQNVNMVANIIDSFIEEMKKNGMENYRVENFIRELDISLMMLERGELTVNQWNNIKLAQKILINKIINRKIHDVTRTSTETYKN